MSNSVVNLTPQCMSEFERLWRDALDNLDEQAGKAQEPEAQEQKESQEVEPSQSFSTAGTTCACTPTAVQDSARLIAYVISGYAKGSYSGGWCCDRCRRSGSGERWFCHEHSANICFGCEPKGGCMSARMRFLPFDREITPCDMRRVRKGSRAQRAQARASLGAGLAGCDSWNL